MKSKKNKTLNSEMKKLLLITSIIPILLIATLNTVSSNTKSGEIINSISNGAINLVKERLLSNDSKIQKDLNFLLLNNNIKGIKRNKNNEELVVQGIFNDYIKANKDISYIYIGTEDGKFLLSPYEEIDNTYNPKEQDWYKEAVKYPEKIIISKPYNDEINNKVIITYSKAIFNDQEEFQGVIAIDKNLNELSNEINSLDGEEKNLASIVTEDGVIIADSNTDFIGKNLEEIGSEKKAIKMKEAIDSKENKRIYVKIEDELYYMVKGFENNSKFNIIIFKPAAEIFKGYAQQVGLPIIIFIIIIVIINIISKKFTKRLTYPIKEVVRILKKLETGDFTESIECKEDYNEEVNSMIKGVKSLTEDMSIVLSGVKESSLKVKDGATTLSDIISESSNVGEEIAKSIQEIAGGATSQAGQLDEGVRTVSDLEEEINKSIDSSNNMLSYSREVKKSSEEGSLAIENLNEKYNENIKASDEIAKKIDVLTEKSNKVGTIIDSIKSITEQTNLLALNASIEAARAGEVGRGFAVVAEEVRKLAEESSKSAIEINEVLNEIKSSINKLYEDTIITNKINNETGESLKITKEKFEVIDNTINYLEESIKEVTVSLDRITKSKDKVVNKISEVAEVSQETAAISEEVSAASEEQSSGLQDMSYQAETLKEYSEILNKLVQKFKVK